MMASIVDPVTGGIVVVMMDRTAMVMLRFDGRRTEATEYQHYQGGTKGCLKHGDHLLA